ncbi:MAG: hypothetical protein KAT28_05685 [Candidatus Aenigmarchaeota archaeon]|nr:hypothetical protein [Candidatus Aenigmarchaeota archaeon]
MGIYDYRCRVLEEDEPPGIRLNVPNIYKSVFPKNCEIIISPENLKIFVPKCEEKATEIAGNLKKVDDKMFSLKKEIPLEGYDWMIKCFNGAREVDTTMRTIDDNVVGRYLPDSVVAKLALDNLYVKNRLGRLPNPMDVIDKKGDEDLYIYRKIANIPQEGGYNDNMCSVGLTLEDLVEGFQLRGVDLTGEFRELTELNPKITYEIPLLPIDMINHIYNNVEETTPILEVLKMFVDSGEKTYSYGISNLISGYFESLCEDRSVEYKKAVICENLLGSYTKILD